MTAEQLYYFILSHAEWIDGLLPLTSIDVSKSASASNSIAR